MTEIISEVSGPRWVPQIVLLIDDETRVLRVNRSLAGNSFDTISESAQQRVHSQLHPDCDGKCRFNEVWLKAWASLKNRDSIEWELDDSKLGRLLRLNLAMVPEPRIVEHERRERHKLLTITDITKYRREYESLAEQQQALIRLLMAQRFDSDDPREDAFDESGDTGNRLMAGYVRTERSFNRQLILAQEKERKRVASELHDGIAQTIGVVKYRIEDCLANLGQRYPDIDLSIFDGAIAEFKGLVDEVRRISSNLSPSMVEDFGIQVALNWLFKEFRSQNRDVGVDSAIVIDESETSEVIKVAIYRVAQEALNNIAKHASATQVRALLNSADGGVELVISDDGAGFDAASESQGYDGKAGLGLRSMRERVEATGGEFTLVSEPGKGAEIRAKWAAEELKD
jgi:signal transduction histidine kinase